MTLSFARSLLVPLGVAWLVIAPSAAQTSRVVPEARTGMENATGGLAGFEEGGLDKVLDSACGTRNEAGEIVLADCPTEPEGASAASEASSAETADEGSTVEESTDDE